MREEADERREESERDVPSDVGADEAEDRGGDQTDERHQNGGNERLSQRTPIVPSPFVADWIARLAAPSHAPRRALDVAAGRGRHLLALARAGFDPFGVDIRLDALADARAAAADAGCRARLWCADLTSYPLPWSFFDVIVVSRYLQRDLFAPIARALRDGGVVIYETFTTAQLAFGTGPRSPDHLLRPQELRAAFPTLDIVFYEEVPEPEALARLVGRRSR